MEAQDNIPQSTSTIPKATLAELFRALNRGIIVASVYSLIVLIAASLALPHTGDMILVRIIFGIMGLVAGAIAGFSNTDVLESQKRDLLRNTLDGLMVIVWTSIIILAFNLISVAIGQDLRFAPTEALILIGIFAAGTLLGGLIGEPLLTLMSRMEIHGRHPFLFVNGITAGIENKDVRFVTRVLVQTIFLVITAVIAIITLIIVLIIKFIAYMLPDGDNSTPTYQDNGGQLYLPKGHHIRPADGRVVPTGTTSGSGVGVRFQTDPSGLLRLFKEGPVSNEDMGVLMDGDGRVIKDNTVGANYDVDVWIAKDGGIKIKRH